MQAISYSSLRSNLASTLDKLTNDHTPIMITRQNSKAEVIMSVEDFNAYEETYYLMASPKNAERLNEAIAEISANNMTEHGLIE